MFSSLGLAFSYPPSKNFAPVVTTIYQVPTLCQVQSYMISDAHGNPARSAFSSRGINKEIASGGLRGLPAWKRMGGKPGLSGPFPLQMGPPHGSQCSALSGSTGKRKRVFSLPNLCYKGNTAFSSNFSRNLEKPYFHIMSLGIPNLPKDKH